MTSFWLFKMLTIYQPGIDNSFKYKYFNLSSLIDPGQQQLKCPQIRRHSSIGLLFIAMIKSVQGWIEVLFSKSPLSSDPVPGCSAVSCLDNYSLSFKPAIFLTMNPKCGEWWSCFPRSVLLLFGFDPTRKDIKTNQL